MEEGAAAVLVDVVGRDPELGGLREFVQGDAGVQALVLCGEAGIGKTTLWEAGVEYAREPGKRTLVARPSGAEAGLSFAALIGRIGARRPRGAGELTATEREVVELAASGRSNKEIAHALSLAVHTVEVHLSRAYAKLGVRSRSQLAGRLLSVR